jgi:hypothetical protein
VKIPKLLGVSFDVAFNDTRSDENKMSSGNLNNGTEHYCNLPSKRLRNYSIFEVSAIIIIITRPTTDNQKFLFFSLAHALLWQLIFFSLYLFFGTVSRVINGVQFCHAISVLFENDNVF